MKQENQRRVELCDRKVTVELKLKGCIQPVLHSCYTASGETKEVTVGLCDSCNEPMFNM